MERCLLAIAASGLLVSCASKEPSHGGDYKLLAARPTTRDWAPGAVWAFVTTRKSGTTESLTLRVTDEIAQSCTSGTWRKLQVVSGRVPQLPGGASQPAYLVEGAFLWINLLAPSCDIDDYIRGRLESKKFAGDRTQGSMMGSDVVGTVRGWRVN
jgi:hypothetical protein